MTLIIFAFATVVVNKIGEQGITVWNGAITTACEYILFVDCILFHTTCIVEWNFLFLLAQVVVVVV